MSEFLRSNPESFENKQESDPDIAELAVNGLSRVANEQEDDADYDGYYEEDNYDDTSTTRRMITMMTIIIVNMRSNIMVRNVLTSMKKN